MERKTLALGLVAIIAIAFGGTMTVLFFLEEPEEGVGPGGVYPTTGDTVYSDGAGTITLASGTYFLYSSGGNSNYMTIGVGGSCTAVNCTPPSTVFFMSGVANSCNAFCNKNIRGIYNSLFLPSLTSLNSSYGTVNPYTIF